MVGVGRSWEGNGVSDAADDEEEAKIFPSDVDCRMPRGRKSEQTFQGCMPFRRT